VFKRNSFVFDSTFFAFLNVVFFRASSYSSQTKSLCSWDRVIFFSLVFAKKKTTILWISSFLNLKLINKKISCFCVGNATERKAKSTGFQNIFCADGNVNNLKELILQNFNSSDGKLLYVSGEIISNQLDQQLISEGYNIKRIINYTANPVEKFNDKFIEKLKLKMPEIVYIYSENSAISFLNLIKNYQLENLWLNSNLMCIGEKTSAVLNEIKWKKIFLFNPGEEEFLLYKI